MSTSLSEVLEEAGYDVDTYEDAITLLSWRREWDELIEQAEVTVEEHEESEFNSRTAELEEEEKSYESRQV